MFFSLLCLILLWGEPATTLWGGYYPRLDNQIGGWIPASPWEDKLSFPNYLPAHSFPKQKIRFPVPFEPLLSWPVVEPPGYHQAVARSHAGKARASSEFPGDGPLFCMVVMGELWRGKDLRDFIPGLLLTAADMPFLSLLHGLMILGHQPILLGKFPVDQYEDVLSYYNAVYMN